LIYNSTLDVSNYHIGFRVFTSGDFLNFLSQFSAFGVDEPIELKPGMTVVRDSNNERAIFEFKKSSRQIIKWSLICMI
jgi:hypothetical protein